ncbi:hypothetical protein DENIS_0718 [Desulfonema ishimotonii]|uniref:Uncharacterized protein n=1 Tax=Desulfonema ishimotonii TaxID=45657 RepID=A0A401FS34_9BACT|nr:hypothetical protein [Desulfonema ishimotonii]GBC59777.1 hypothetical protein DENIS_0718 [Desulfonema ishimotonii]
MSDHYLYENFCAESGMFDQSFTEYLNEKRKDDWKVKTCSYCHDKKNGKTWAGCIFKR